MSKPRVIILVAIVCALAGAVVAWAGGQYEVSLPVAVGALVAFIVFVVSGAVRGD